MTSYSHRVAVPPQLMVCNIHGTHFTKDVWRLWYQKQVSQAWISNCIPQNAVGCNYLSLSEILASGATVDIWAQTPISISCYQKNTGKEMQLGMGEMNSCKNYFVLFLDHKDSTMSQFCTSRDLYMDWDIIWLLLIYSMICIINSWTLCVIGSGDYAYLLWWSNINN